MGGCAGRHLGGPRSSPGGCKKFEETRREVLQRFLPRVAPLADTSFSSQFVRKLWKLRVFLETTRKHSNGSDSYLSLEVTPCCGGNFSQMTFSSCESPSFPIGTVSRLLGYFAIRSERRLWISHENRPKIHASLVRLRNDYNACKYARYFTIRSFDENNKRYANGITNLMELNGTALICFNKSDKS